MANTPATPAASAPHAMIFELVGETVSLEPFGSDGDRRRGACPFHPDPTTSLYVQTAGWYCFACQAGGDAVEWIMQRNMVGRDEARILVQRYVSRH